MFAYYAVLQSLNDDLLAVRHLNHIALCLNELHGIANDCIVVLVMFGQCMQAAPCAEVAPTEF